MNRENLYLTRKAGSTKVLHLLYSLNVGGAERLALNLCGGLKDNGEYLPHVCSLTDEGGLTKEFLARGIPTFFLEKPAGLSFKIVMKLARLIKKEGIQILHTHNTGPWIYGALTSLCSRIKLVHTEHSNVTATGSSLFFLEKLLSYCTNTIVCDANQVADFMIRRQKINARKIKVIWNGIDVDLFHNGSGNNETRKQLNLTDKTVIGSVARLSEEKDQKNLLSAFEIVKSAIPDAFLLFVGDGPMREDIELEINRKNLSNDVHITGFVQDVRKYLGSMDLFVLSSKREGLPLSILEAMAAGLPVVATDVGGNHEVIVNGKTGLLVPSGDSAALADAIIDVFSKIETLKRLGESGRNLVTAKFDLKKMVKEYEAVYCSTN